MDQPLPSKSALIRIGKAIAAGTETSEHLDQLDVLLAWCDDVQARATERLEEALPSFEHRAGGQLVVRGRAKTLITLREKLARMGGHQLPVIRDLAGLRIVGDITLDEQDRLLPYACAALGVAETDCKVIDRRAEPMRGYRALHGEFPLEGVRVELQVRTVLQHQWAEIYERAGDRFGRGIRYGDQALDFDAGSPRDRFAGTFVRAMQQASHAIATLERRRRLEAVFKPDQLITDETGGGIQGGGEIVDVGRDLLHGLLQELGELLDELDQLDPEGGGRR